MDRARPPRRALLAFHGARRRPGKRGPGGSRRRIDRRTLPFHETFGVCAHGVTIDAFVAPPDWTSRAGILVDPISGVPIRAPHPSDLAVAKLVRGDDRDWAFTAYVREHFGVSRADLERGLRAAAAARPAYAAAAAKAIDELPARLPD